MIEPEDRVDPLKLPPWYDFRTLAVDLNLDPDDRTKMRELERILLDFGVPMRRSQRHKSKRRIYLSDLEEYAPFLVRTLLRLRQLRASGMDAESAMAGLLPDDDGALG